MTASIPPYAKLLADRIALEPVTLLIREATHNERAACTAVYEATLRDHVLMAVKNWRPGAKVKCRDKYKAKKEIKDLGPLPKKSLAEWHGNKDTLPGAYLKTVMWCIHRAREQGENDGEAANHSDKDDEDVDLEGSFDTVDETGAESNPSVNPKKLRRSWVDDECDCKFEVTIRDISLAEKVEYIAITVVDGQHDHTCGTEKAGLAPLTPEDENYLIMSLFVHGGDCDAVWNKVLAPMINKADSSTIFSRLLRLKPKDLKRFARTRGLDGQIDHGKADFEKMLNTVKDWIARGDNAAAKLPGQTSEEAIGLVPDAANYLTKEDLFVYVQTSFQVALLERFGTCMATDATYAVVSYGRVKLICLHVTSYGEATIDERGFNTAFVLTTAERAEVHAAIVAQTIARTGNRWKPRILMTDMAFAAINGWKKFFPDIQPLWCVFHVWQAIRKLVYKQPRPKDMDEPTFKSTRKKVIAGFLAIISPDHEMPWEEFDSRICTLRDFLWGNDLSEIAIALDRYNANKLRWAPPARRDVVNTVFGPRAPLPMLAVSNNSLERFFGVLKYVLLKGRNAYHFSALLEIWWINQARIRSDAWAVGIDVRSMLELAPQGILNCDTASQLSELNERLDDEIVAGLTAVDNPVGDDSIVKSEEDEDTVADLQGEFNCKPSTSGDGIVQSTVSSSALAPIFARVVADDRKSRGSVNVDPHSIAIQSLRETIVRGKNQLDAFLSWAEASIGTQSYSPTFLNVISTAARVVDSMASKLESGSSVQVESTTAQIGVPSFQKFRPQRENYGPDPQVLTEEILSACSANLEKQEKAVHEFDDDDENTLEAYDNLVGRLVMDAAFMERVRVNMTKGSCQSFPALRHWLLCNTKVRLVAVLHIVLQQTSATINWVKSRLIADIISVIEDKLAKVEDEVRVELERDVVDVARLLEPYQPFGQMSLVYPSGSLVVLRSNAVDNYGEPCLTPTNNVLGWVLAKGMTSVCCVEIPLAKLVWSNFGEKLKDVADLTARATAPAAEATRVYGRDS